MKRMTPSDLFQMVVDRLELDKNRYYQIRPGNGEDYTSDSYIVDIDQFTVTIELPEEDDPVLSIKVSAYMHFWNKSDIFVCGSILGYEEDPEYILDIAKRVTGICRSVAENMA